MASSLLRLKLLTSLLQETTMYRRQRRVGPVTLIITTVDCVGSRRAWRDFELQEL